MQWYAVSAAVGNVAEIPVDLAVEIAMENTKQLVPRAYPMHHYLPQHSVETRIMSAEARRRSAVDRGASTVFRGML